jgi:hypothetical protein
MTTSPTPIPLEAALAGGAGRQEAARLAARLDAGRQRCAEELEGGGLTQDRQLRLEALQRAYGAALDLLPILAKPHARSS